MDQEIWKEIKGFEGKYYISNHGRVKSLGGKFTTIHPEGYITNGATDTFGYKSITLRKVTPTIKRYIERYRVHTLVAKYFIEQPEGCKVVNHLDGNRKNNHYSNLEWTTYLGNSQHAIRTGLFDIKGEKHHNAKLTKEKVLEMRRLRKEEGWTHQRIANMFGVDRRQAGDVINGVNWGWLH